MAHLAGEPESDAPRLIFDRRLMPKFRGSSVASMQLLYRELDDGPGLRVGLVQCIITAGAGCQGTRKTEPSRPLGPGLAGTDIPCHDKNDPPRFRATQKCGISCLNTGPSGECCLKESEHRRQ